jgi:hypothetical protein
MRYISIKETEVVMKKYLFAFVLTMAFLLLQKGVYAQEISFGVFYSSLSPYGEWVEVGDYGMCWRPVGVPIGWRPYVDGHWIWTEYGWTWVSDYPWGWAPFHYGRWTFDPEYGWIWIPGYVWAPAWVEWRWGNGYLGWAPMPPGFHFRMDIVVGPDYHDFGVGMGGWNFIRVEEMGRPRYHYLERESVPRVIGSTRNVTEYRFTSGGVYNVGLPRERVEQVTHRRIEAVSIVRTNEVGRQRLMGGRFQIYAPAPFKPQIRNEQEFIQRERMHRVDNPQYMSTPPAHGFFPPHGTPTGRVRNEGSAPASQPQAPTQHHGESEQKGNRPKQETRSNDNDHGRQRQPHERDRDNGRGR